MYWNIEVNIRDFEGDRFSSLFRYSYLSVELQLSQYIITWYVIT